MDEHDLETAERLVRLETKLDQLADMPARLAKIEHRLASFFGGVAMVATLLSVFANQLWDKLAK